MILGKLWRSLMAQINKIANIFWTADPIAQMQYEYDQAVAQLKEGREGLEQYRALVERVTRQVANDKQHVAQLEAKVKAYLTAGDRETAAKFALEMQKAKQDLAENEGQLKLHEESYGNNVTKIKHASKKLSDVRDKISKYDAELKMSKAEAEMAKLATDFNFDVTTDFGQIEQVINDKISLNRAKVRVAADLSGDGIEDVKREQAMESALADQALREFEIQVGFGYARHGRRNEHRQGTRPGGSDEANAAGFLIQRSARYSFPGFAWERGCSLAADRTKPQDQSPRSIHVHRAGSLPETHRYSIPAPCVVSRLGERIGRCVFLGHDLGVSAAWKRSRFDRNPRCRRQDGVLQYFRVSGHAIVRQVGPRRQPRPEPRPAAASRRECRPAPRDDAVSFRRAGASRAAGPPNRKPFWDLSRKRSIGI